MPQVLLDNLVQVRRLHKTIPDLLRIHDDRRPMLALLQAAGFVHPQHTRQLRRLDLVFEQRVKLSLPIRTTRGPGRTLLTLIRANKNMAIKFWQ